MSDTDNMVLFEMADGTKVSNDPRFGLEEALQKQLESEPYRGDAGIPADEQAAQVSVTHPASINSGQPGVGENAVAEDPVRDAHGPLGSPAMQIQKDDLAKAQEDGADQFNTSTDDAEPIDSNQAVIDARKAKEEAAETYRKAQEKLAAADQEEGDPDEPLSEWTGAQLKAEVAKRNADGRDEEKFLKIKSGMRKPDVVKMLEEDTEANPPADDSGDSGDATGDNS